MSARSAVPGRARATSRPRQPHITIAGTSELMVPRLRGVSHAVACVVSVAAAIVLVPLAPTARATIGVAIYGIGLIALFAGSALYHRWPGPAHLKPVLQRLDHSTIFLFIAASYTPIAFVVLHGALAWIILGVAWTGAVAGVAFSLRWIDAPRGVVAGSYLGLGWVAVIALPQLLVELRPAPLILVTAGGLLYSRRRDRLREAAPEPVAADVRLSRGFPRPGDRSGRRVLHRDGRVDAPVRKRVKPTDRSTHARTARA